ncbi:uncharacterized protein LOC117779980 [Drosophila innubila]|uniref:uncharacterized protein LOC117779980 n=1 Tax=Drosophila innubila TaxID=198719 RepID=UPI00148B95BD|nr:uncharacterized protein LOC117779980 [Drosophila innubila]
MPRTLLLLSLTLTLCILGQVDAGRPLKVLGLFPHPGVSHFHFFHPIMHSLAEAGHDVSVVSHFPTKNPPIRYKDFPLSGMDKLTNSVDLKFFEKRSFYNHFLEFFLLHEWGKQSCNLTLRSEALQTILKRKAGYFDVIVMEQFNSDCMMGVAYHLQAPVVALSSCAMMPWHYERMGAPIIPSHIPALFLGQSQDMDLGGRLANWFSFHALNFMYKWYSIPAADALVQYKFGHDMPSVGELAKNTSVFLVNQHYSLSGPKPLPPNVIEVGGLHIQKSKPLSADLQRLLDNAEDGVILISWGSMIRANSLSASKRDGIVRAVARLKQKVIWKWENDTLPNMPSNMHIMKWLPQRDILCHPNVKVFMTHAGLMGSSEASYCGVPTVVTPMYGDQFLNAAALMQRGMGVLLNYEDISENTVLRSLKRAMDPKLADAAKAVSHSFHHRPQQTLLTAIWWVEHVAYTHGDPLIKPSSVEMSRFVYYSLDVYLVIGSILGIVIASWIALIKRCRGKRPVLKSKHDVKMIRKWSWKLLLLFSIFGFGQGLNILGFFPHPAISHFQFFHPIMRRLAESGHTVDVVSPFPDSQPPPGYTDYLLPGVNISISLDFDIFEGRRLSFLLPFVDFAYLYTYGKDACRNTLNGEALEQILRNPPGYYDVILMEQFNTDCLMGVAYKLNAPVVALCSSALMPWHYERMGAPLIPSYMSALFLGQSQEMSFGARLGNWVTTHTLNWIYKLLSVPAGDELLRQRFGPGIPSTSELVKNTSLILINQHFSLSGPKPLPPNVIEVGGAHIKKANPLDDELQQLLDNAKHGVILISWGSQLKTTSLNMVKRDGLLRALGRLKQQIIWKWENETLTNKPDNVHIMKWLPQRDILAHPNLRVFFTHGGLLGLTEAVSSGVPLVGMPICGDQFLNIASLEQRGMAVKLDFGSLNEQSVFEALSEALNAKYKLNAQRIAMAYNDRPQHPLDTAVWWVEHVAETRGAPLLQSSAVHLSRFAYYSLDVYLVIFSTLLLLIGSSIGLWRLCCGSKRQHPSPKRKSKIN